MTRLLDAIPGWLRQAVVASAFFGAGLGLGTMGTFMLLLADHPSIIIRDRWRVVEVPTPVKGIEPTTPFGIDPNIYILDLPITTTTTRKPVPTTTSAPTTTTTSTPTTATTEQTTTTTIGQKL